MERWVMMMMMIIMVLTVDYDPHYCDEVDDDEDYYDDESQVNDDGVPFKPRSPLLTSRD